MPGRPHRRDRDFGRRLAKARKARGLSQTGLADRLGVSQRVVAHYEGGVGYIPPVLVVKMAEALRVSTDELLGAKNGHDKSLDDAPNDVWIWKRIRQVKSLPLRDQRAVFRLLDTLATQRGTVGTRHRKTA